MGIKHTPGPWYGPHSRKLSTLPAFFAKRAMVEVVSTVSDMVPIADCGPADCIENLANARLIAAAPRLASAAEALLEAIGYVTGIEKERREMIAALNDALGAVS